MKVLALNGSSRENGVTYHGLKIVCDELQNLGIETEIMHIGYTPMAGCQGCKACRTKKHFHRCIVDDGVNKVIDQLKNIDGFIFGAPAHFIGLPGTTKSFLDRLFYATEQFQDTPHKIGTAISVCRRSGAITTFHQLNNYFNCSNMITVNSQYWNILFGLKPNEIEQDKEGIQTLKLLARNLAWVLKVFAASKGVIEEPPIEIPRIRSNFCR